MSVAPSALSFEVLQKRLRTRELRTPELDNQNRKLFGIPSQMVVREAFMADREVAIEAAAWDALRVNRRLER
jgi:hypothetical protein